MPPSAATRLVDRQIVGRSDDLERFPGASAVACFVAVDDENRDLGVRMVVGRIAASDARVGPVVPRDDRAHAQRRRSLSGFLLARVLSAQLPPGLTEAEDSVPCRDAVATGPPGRRTAPGGRRWVFPSPWGQRLSTSGQSEPVRHRCRRPRRVIFTTATAAATIAEVASPDTHRLAEKFTTPRRDTRQRQLSTSRGAMRTGKRAIRANPRKLEQRRPDSRPEHLVVTVVRRERPSATTPLPSTAGFDPPLSCEIRPGSTRSPRSPTLPTAAVREPDIQVPHDRASGQSGSSRIQERVPVGLDEAADHHRDAGVRERATP